MNYYQEIECMFNESVKTNATQKNKYIRSLKGVDVDVYDVLKAFDVGCPAMQHAIKKMLCSGLRGYKDQEQDKREAIASIERSIELDNGHYL